MARRFSRIVVTRIATLAAMRWLGIHAPAPAVRTSKLTFNTLQFGISAGAVAAESEFISSFRTL